MGVFSNVMSIELAARAGTEPRPPFTREQTLNGLSWLARGMIAQRQSIFLVEQLQPAWLATREQYWLYWVGTRVLVALLIGLIQAGTAHVGGTPLGRVVYVITAFLAGALIGIVDGAGAGMARTLARWPLLALQASSALIAALVAGVCFYLAFGPGLGRGPTPGGWQRARPWSTGWSLAWGASGPANPATSSLSRHWPGRGAERDAGCCRRC